MLSIGKLVAGQARYYLDHAEGRVDGEAVAELGAEVVPPAAAHALDRRLGVRLAAATAMADAPAFDSVEPLVAERPEGGATTDDVGQVVSALLRGAERDKDLTAILGRLAPRGPAR